MRFLAAGFSLALASALSVNASAATVVLTYHPTHMRIVRALHGSCFTGSIAVARADAYRCMVGNDIFDPCFADGARAVACPTDLAADRGMRITISTLPANPISTPSSVWAMTLQNGAMCSIITGTGVAGYPFGCTRATECAGPHKIGSQYLATCAPENAKGAGRARVYRVTKVWY